LSGIFEKYSRESSDGSCSYGSAATNEEDAEETSRAPVEVGASIGFATEAQAVRTAALEARTRKYPLIAYSAA